MCFYEMAEILFKGDISDEYWDYVYRLLKEVLQVADANGEMKVLVLLFKVKMLFVLGIEPVINCCVKCRNGTNVVFLSVKEGGLMCSRCFSGEEEILIDAKLIPIVRAMFKIPLGRFMDVVVDKDDLANLDEFIVAYYEVYSGISLGSRIVVKSPL